MKWMPTFDQVICSDLNISAQDGILLDMLINAPTWANHIEMNDQLYWFLSQSKIRIELPCVFGSAPAVTRSIKRIEKYATAIKHQRRNYYKIHPIIAKFWCKKKDSDEYDDFIKNEKDPDLVSISKVNSFDSESNLVSLSKAIHLPVNTSTKIKREKSSRFSPPSVQDVSEYCHQRGNQINADSFINFYESKGWMVGKNKMKSWQAAVRTWEQRDNEKGNNGFGNQYPDLLSTNF